LHSVVEHTHTEHDMPENTKNPKQDQRQRNPQDDANKPERDERGVGESTVGNPDPTRRDPSKMPPGKGTVDEDLDLDDFDDEDDIVTR
jgi:hypothetical protein